MRSEKLTTARGLYFNHQYHEATLEFQKWFQEGDIDTRVEAAYFIGKILSILDFPLNQINFYFDFVLKSGNSFYMAKVYTEKGLYYRKKSKFSQMVDCYKAAIGINPYEIKALTDLAFYSLTTNQLDSAIEYYEALLFVNRNTIPYNRKVRNDNISYIGLATSMIKKNKLDDARNYLSQVKKMNTKDRENLNKCYANIAFLEEKYDDALAFLADNTCSEDIKVRTEALEKQGIIYAIQDKDDEAIETLKMLNRERQKEFPIKNHYANYILGYVYYKHQKYQEGHDANVIASRKYPRCLIYALKCAMHLDPYLAVDTANEVIKKSTLIDRYRPYILYLSKKYNIFFPELDYNNLTNKEAQLLNYSLEELILATKENCSLTAEVSAENLINTIIPAMLADLEPHSNEYSDVYIIYYPGIGNFGEDYIAVTTYKGTKDIIDIKLLSKTMLKYYQSSGSLRYKPLIRNLFI